MSKFIIKDERRYPFVPHIGNDALSYWRFDHRATIEYQARIFMVFADNFRGTMHIEEITTGDLKIVEEDELHAELTRFAREKGFLEIMIPIPKDKAHRPLT
jgi:hypothetical protein